MISFQNYEQKENNKKRKPGKPFKYTKLNKRFTLPPSQRYDII